MRVKVHAEVGSPRLFMMLVRLLVVVKRLFCGPLVVLELIRLVVNGAVRVVDWLHTMIFGEILDMVRVVILQVRRVLDRGLVEVYWLEIMWVVVLVVELGVIADVFTIEVGTVHRQLVVV